MRDHFNWQETVEERNCEKVESFFTLKVKLTTNIIWFFYLNLKNIVFLCSKAKDAA